MQLDELLDFVALTDKRKMTPAVLSGGEQQRVAVARSLIASPDILLADEPTGNLDRANGRYVMELFARANRERGLTVVQVTHADDMAAYGNRIVRLNDGKLSE